MSEPREEDRLPLRQLVQQVRREIRAMIAERDAGQPPRLEIREVQLEVNFVVERSQSLAGEAGGSLFQLLALTSSAEKSARHEIVHKISITLDVLEDPPPGGAGLNAGIAGGESGSGGFGGGKPFDPLPPTKPEWNLPKGKVWMTPPKGFPGNPLHP